MLARFFEDHKQNKPFQGRRMGSLIDARGGNPADVLFDVLIEEDGSVPRPGYSTIPSRTCSW